MEECLNVLKTWLDCYEFHVYLLKQEVCDMENGFEGGIEVPKHARPLNSTGPGLLDHQTP